MAAPPEVLGSGLTSTRSCCTTSGSAVLCDCPGMIVDPSRSPATEASPKEFLLIWSAKPESGPWVLLATESLYLSEPPSLTTLPRIIMPFPATVPRISGSELSIPAVDGAEAAGAFGAGAPPPMRSSRSPPPPEGLAGAAGLESIESKSSRPLLPPPPLGAGTGSSRESMSMTGAGVSGTVVASSSTYSPPPPARSGSSASSKSSPSAATFLRSTNCWGRLW
mmetsp:Transcript_47210/g.111315  ORF Transcript_47210/g.111315 Transcript_47210/m.111315 type:complete len:222 (+) Transcript_47210:638-1303(+)